MRLSSFTSSVFPCHGPYSPVFEVVLTSAVSTLVPFPMPLISILSLLVFLSVLCCWKCCFIQRPGSQCGAIISPHHCCSQTSVTGGSVSIPVTSAACFLGGWWAPDLSCSIWIEKNIKKAFFAGGLGVLLIPSPLEVLLKHVSFLFYSMVPNHGF